MQHCSLTPPQPMLGLVVPCKDLEAPGSLAADVLSGTLLALQPHRPRRSRSRDVLISHRISGDAPGRSEPTLGGRCALLALKEAQSCFLSEIRTVRSSAAREDAGKKPTPGLASLPRARGHPQPPQIPHHGPRSFSSPQAAQTAPSPPSISLILWLSHPILLTRAPTAKFEQTLPELPCSAATLGSAGAKGPRRIQMDSFT